jgi:bacterioferritin
LRRGIELAREVKDTVTRLLLEDILKSEEEHVDYLETQISLVESLGLQEYLSLQV